MERIARSKALFDWPSGCLLYVLAAAVVRAISSGSESS
jgi:hypothetical protein